MKLPLIMSPKRPKWFSGLLSSVQAAFHSPLSDDPRFITFGLVVLYLTFSLVRIFLSFRFLGPGVMSDELLYKTSAQSFFLYGDFYNLNNRGVATNVGNILYQYLISPSFYFGPNFYVVAKAINVLLISAALFPTYLIARCVNDRKSSLLVTILVMLFPSNLYANYMMPESLFFPLFMFSFYFVLRSLTRNSLVDAAASGVCVAVLFLTKPYAVTLILAMIVVVAILMVFARHFSIRRDYLVRSFVFTFMSALTTFIIVTLLIKHRLNTSEVLGFYSGIGWDLITRSVRFAQYFKDLLRMVLGHLTGFLFLYGIPFIVVLAMLVRSFKAKDYRTFTFLLWGSALFLAFLAMTVKYTIDISHHEHFARLHGRYYFFSYPFFLIAFIPFLKRMEPSMLSAAAFIVTGALVGASLVTVFPTFFPPRWGMIVDLPEWAWLNMQNLKITSPVLAAAFLLLCLYYAFSKVRRPSPYILFLLAFLMIGNMGELSQQIGNSNGPWGAVQRPLALIQSTIVGRTDPVMLIGSGADGLMRLHLPFWLPYEKLYVKTLPPGSDVSEEVIPPGTKWVVLLNEYNLTAPISPSEPISSSESLTVGCVPRAARLPRTMRLTGANTAPFGALDAPASGATVGGIVAVKGWALDKESFSGSLTFTLLIDSSPVSAPSRRYARTDVCAVYPERAYPGSCQSGIRFDWNTIGMSGRHTVAIRVTDCEGLNKILGPRALKVEFRPIRSEDMIRIYKLR